MNIYSVGVKLMRKRVCRETNVLNRSREIIHRVGGRREAISLVPWSAPLLCAVPPWSTKAPGPAVQIFLLAPDSDR